jgi:hypothetical protein
MRGITLVESPDSERRWQRGRRRQAVEGAIAGQVRHQVIADRDFIVHTYPCRAAARSSRLPTWTVPIGSSSPSAYALARAAARTICAGVTPAAKEYPSRKWDGRCGGRPGIGPRLPLSKSRRVPANGEVSLESIRYIGLGRVGMGRALSLP